VTVQYFPLAKLDLQALIESTHPLDVNDSTKALHGVLLYNVALPHLGTGSFKFCRLGQLILQPTPDSGLGSHGHFSVALKRPFKRNTNDNHTGKYQRLPPADEHAFISTEAVVWQWGYALLALVQTFVQDHASTKLDDPDRPELPAVRYVEAGVAKCIKPNENVHSLSGSYLVEEQIPSEQGFWRFVGNGSAIPATFDKDSRMFQLAQFYSFCQHVQWVLTNGMAYCADWQGEFL
jgi:hypothetical protein